MSVGNVPVCLSAEWLQYFGALSFRREKSQIWPEASPDTLSDSHLARHLSVPRRRCWRTSHLCHPWAQDTSLDCSWVDSRHGWQHACCENAKHRHTFQPLWTKDHSRLAGVLGSWCHRIYVPVSVHLVPRMRSWPWQENSTQPLRQTWSRGQRLLHMVGPMFARCESCVFQIAPWMSDFQLLILKDNRVHWQLEVAEVHLSRWCQHFQYSSRQIV